MKTDTTETNQNLEASMSVLLMSMASSSFMAMGHTPDPQTGKTSVDKNMSRFHIDLLLVLKEKTKNNLTADEQNLLDHLIQDLQMKFLQLK